MTTSKSHGHAALPGRSLLVLAGGFVLIWGISGGVLYLVGPNWEIRGQVGDMFGAVNSLFSAGALVGVVYAIALQRSELRLQRKELELTRQELERSASAQETTAHGLVEQTRLQTVLLKAQLLRDRFESYWKTYQPVSDAQVAEFRLYPEDYMERSLFEQRYSGDDVAIRRYIYMSILYEYLGFTCRLPAMGVPDPLGPNWIDRRTSDLVDCMEFRDVHEQLRGHYPDYEALVDNLISKRQHGA